MPIRCLPITCWCYYNSITASSFTVLLQTRNEIYFTSNKVCRVQMYRRLLFVAIFAGCRPFVVFRVATFTGFMCPIFSQLCNLAGSLCMAFRTVFQHLLMFMVRENHFSHRSGQFDFFRAFCCKHSWWERNGNDNSHTSPRSRWNWSMVMSGYILFQVLASLRISKLILFPQLL